MVDRTSFLCYLGVVLLVCMNTCMCAEAPVSALSFMSVQSACILDPECAATLCCAGVMPVDDDDDSIMMAMSTLSEDGVMEVKQAACEKLLNFRVEMKVRGHAGLMVCLLGLRHHSRHSVLAHCWYSARGVSRLHICYPELMLNLLHVS